MEDVRDQRVPLDGLVLPRQGCGRDALGKASRAPDLHSVVEDRQRNRASGDGVVAVNEGVDEDLPHGVRRDEQRLHPPHLPGDDPRRHREMALAKDLRFLQQPERGAPDLPLVEELGLVRPPEAGQAKLTLRIVRHEGLAEEDYGSLEDVQIYDPVDCDLRICDHPPRGGRGRRPGVAVACAPKCGILPSRRSE